MSHALWQTRFGADSSIVGRGVLVNDRSVTVIGVAAEGFDGSFGGVSLWLPFLAEGALIPNRPLERVQRRGLRGFYALGRLADGVTLEEAQRQIDLVTTDLHNKGLLPRNRGALAVSFERDNLGQARRTTLVLSAGVGLVLLIACANVANLLLARQLGRVKEIALRQSIGASKLDLFRQLLMESMVLASDIPLNRGYSAISVELAEPEHAGREVRVYVHRVSPGYFETLGIPVVRGRGFSDADRAGGPEVVVISQQMADRFWSNADPLGRTVDDATIVGVVGNATYRGLIPDQVSSPDDPDIFVPLALAPVARLQIAARGVSAATDMADLIRGAVRRLDSTLPVFGMTTMDAILDQQLASTRTATQLLAAFASIALVLAVGGLFGVMMYTVGRRTNEIGIRMALGAEPTRVMWMFLGQGAGLVALGLIAGLFLALGTLRVLASQLYDVGTLGTSSPMLRRQPSS